MTVEPDACSPDSVVSLEFELSDPSVPVVALSEVESGRFTLEEVIPRGDGTYVTYYSVSGCDPDRIVDLAPNQEPCEVSVLDRTETGGILEVLGPAKPPSMVLATHGAFPRRALVENGTMSLTAEVPAATDPNEIIARFTDAYPDATLVARRQQSYLVPIFSCRGFERTLEECLTDRQREVLRAAHDEGFYEWPREVTGQKLSEKLGISPPTFHQHLRAAEEKLVQLTFEGSVPRRDHD